MRASGRVDVKITHTHTLLGSPFNVNWTKDFGSHRGPEPRNLLPEQSMKNSSKCLNPPLHQLSIQIKKKQIAKSKFLKATVGTRL